MHSGQQQAEQDEAAVDVAVLARVSRGSDRIISARSRLSPVYRSSRVAGMSPEVWVRICRTVTAAPGPGIGVRMWSDNGASRSRSPWATARPTKGQVATTFVRLATS
ncbi:hypothetical protein HFP72_02255 [Nocardiopsis sp. ARC36]